LPWTQHIRAASSMMQRAFDLAQEQGDVLWAAFSQRALISFALASGARLESVQTEAERYVQSTRRARLGVVIDSNRMQLALIRTLRGLTPTFGYLDDSDYDESGMEQHLLSSPMLARAACWHWIRKAQARYLAGEYRAAVDASSKAQPLLSSTHFDLAEFVYYGALSHAACWDLASPDDKTQHFAALKAHHDQLDIWAKDCPENFANRVALVAAEIARIEGRDVDAMRHYEQAIRSAHANGFIHTEAIAYEIAARFYASRGFEKFAESYLREARYGYLRWGADGKVRQIDKHFPQLRRESLVTGATGTIAAPIEHLDLATVIKVSQAVSGEVVLEKLIDRLMRAAIEHAGAERGLLIAPQSDEIQTKAEATASGKDVAVYLQDGAHRVAAMPEPLVRYVMRTREIVILGDASVQTPFSADPYIARSRARSILCLPLINQTKLISVLYLENNLTPHAFTPERVTVLKVLASQAAIALENSELYRDLEDREGQIRTQEMELRQMVDFAPQYVAVFGPGRERLYANRIFLDFLGLTLEEWRQRLDRDEFIHPDDRERVNGHFDRVVSSGAGFESEVRVRKSEGSHRWFLARCNPVRDDKGQVMRWYIACTDIEDRKRAEEKLQRENAALREEIDKASMFEEIVGTSGPLKAVLSRIAKVGPTNSTVLITGETGTGKELIARAVHKRSQRSGRPFISVNCAALPPTLVSSELFGHEKGAFTGATQRRLGRFEMADGGTIFLDEVGELLPDTQAALLRVLQEREFERVGGGHPIKVDVRVIAATNRDLNAAVANGTFRHDLLYRLNVFPIEVPPLRERKDDILMLVDYFVQRFANRAGKNILSIDQKTLDLLQSYDWPGNIRELQNVIERSVILSSGDVFSVDELWIPKETIRPAPRARTSPASNAEPRSEREIIEAALAETRGRVSGPSGAAAKLGIPSSTLETRIKALNINKQRFKFGERFSP
jgi:PAS domain S-box-containing protein